MSVLSMDLYKPVHRTSFHSATLLKRGKPIATARNAIGSRSRGCGYSDQTIHAERAVVKRLGDLSRLNGCVLVVIRLNKQGEVLGSAPCADCRKFLEKCMREYGLRKVIYS